MEQARSSYASRSVARAVLTVLIVAIGLGAAGCGEQMARIDENQAKLQMMVKANALQINEIADRLEKNQQELYAAIESVKNDVARVSADVGAVAEAQTALNETVSSGSMEMSDRIAQIGQEQKAVSTSLGQAIAAVRTETGKVAADVTDVKADVAAVTAEQTRLYETVQENNVQLTDKVAALEQTQLDRQNTIGGMEDNIQEVAASIGALGEDVLRLQEILQSNIRELVSIADISGQKQSEFQASIQNDIKTLDDSIATLKASQEGLQSRIEQMQSDAPDLRDMPAAIDQLRDQLEELSLNQTSADDFGAIEYETSADTSAETDGIE